MAEGMLSNIKARARVAMDFYGEGGTHVRDYPISDETRIKELTATLKYIADYAGDYTAKADAATQILEDAEQKAADLLYDAEQAEDAKHDDVYRDESGTLVFREDDES